LNGRIDELVISMMSGERHVPGASLFRALAGLAEHVYTAAVNARNRRFDRGTGIRSLPRPVISVGNITAGGTGKTPVVRWLCESLRRAGHHPAVLLRGYKAAGGLSDEQRMLEQCLAAGGVPVPVHANPDRFEGGMAVLARRADVDVFVLDDGFQHRKLARDFDLVLIDATNPFGFYHVHPRGLLREPLVGLRRASAILITRSDEIAGITETLQLLIRRHSQAPIYAASHAHAGFRSATSDVTQPPDHPTSDLAGRRVFAFCGIGNPDSFLRQVEHFAGPLAGSRRFGDHHAYTDADVRDLIEAARGAGANVMVTTEKDWAKLSTIPSAASSEIPIWRAALAIEFRGDDGARLFQHITSVIEQARARLVTTPS
jgi:tetraacyldisaccharide 4'-kinase